MITNTTGIPTSHTHTHVQIILFNTAMSLSRGAAEDVCGVGMPVIIRIPPLFAYFLALPSLLPSAITLYIGTQGLVSLTGHFK